MKKQLVKNGIEGFMMIAAGLIAAGCTTMGGAGLSYPPDGSYYNHSQGYIEFDAGAKTWKAENMGYKGSYNFDQGTSVISLSAEQGLQGLQWTAITPVSFTARAGGRVAGNAGKITLGDFEFRSTSNGDDGDGGSIGL
jgi:hypothetical protein